MNTNKPHDSNGKLLAFEGAHSCGKTSISMCVAEKLSALPGHIAIWRAFPGRMEGTLGSVIYDFHHHSSRYVTRPPSPLALQALHIAAHIDNIQFELADALARGVTVVLDRCWWSTWVHGMDGGCDEQLLNRFLEIEKQVWGLVNCTVFLVQRAEAFTPKIVELYRQIAKREQGKVRVEYIQNEGTINDVSERIVNMIQ